MLQNVTSSSFYTFYLINYWQFILITSYSFYSFKLTSRWQPVITSQYKLTVLVCWDIYRLCKFNRNVLYQNEVALVTLPAFHAPRMRLICFSYPRIINIQFSCPFHSVGISSCLLTKYVHGACGKWHYALGCIIYDLNTSVLKANNEFQWTQWITNNILHVSNRFSIFWE